MIHSSSKGINKDRENHMIGIVIVTHGNLAREFKAVIEHVMGPQIQFCAFGIQNEDDISQKRKELLKIVKSLDQGMGVAVLTDMFGGTPSNLALSLLDLKNVEVMAGVNLPLLIKLISLRDKKSLQESMKEAQEAGQRYINLASHFLAASSE
jgi:PTS system mannose-specific IIA component